jgi:3D-(3,5/4)-trihydroxycyclohexane-1,2-dione acylhydrolase (decyclizing)
VSATTPTVRLTMAQALVRWLCVQQTVIDGAEQPVFPGVFAIFGHGNVTCLGEALYDVRDRLPTYRGQNEQGMALAAVAFAKARRRRQIMVATSSIGPGALNMVTAAGVAMANRLPVLLLSGETFASRLPDPVLQQVEHFDDPGRTVNDAFRPVTRYWDRITRPAQLLSSLPQALATMLDPGSCGPAFLALPQDIQAEAFDYPEAFFDPVVHEVPRPRPATSSLTAAADVIRRAARPLIVAGGGVHYSQAEADLAALAERHGVPVVETVAGRISLPWDHPLQAGPIGVTGSNSANALARDADVVIAVGTRLQDFSTGSWTVFQDPGLRIVSVNTARFDATKHRAVPVVGDARESLRELAPLLAGWHAPQAWEARARDEYAEWCGVVDKATVASSTGPPTYAQVVAAVNAVSAPDDVVLTAAGGLPGELNKVWRGSVPGTFDCEYGFSCMGYEVSGGWGAKLATPDADVFVLVGDGSYLMLSSDIYSSVLTGQKLIVVLCDNSGFAVIDRLQRSKGCASFNNMLDDTSLISNPTVVDFAAHAASMGAMTETAESLTDLTAALGRAKASDRTTVVVLRTAPDAWLEGGAWWDVGVPEVSARPEVRAARTAQDEGRREQRLGL